MVKTMYKDKILVVGLKKLIKTDDWNKETVKVTEVQQKVTAAQSETV